MQSIRPLVEAFNDLLTEQARQHQELLAARHAADAAVIARTRFLATMSHEIRTPMHAILGTTELLRRVVLPPDVAALITEQRAAATALMAVLNDVLDFVKIEANHLDLDEQPYDLVALIQETTLAFSSMATERALTLQVDPPLPSSLPIRGDAARVRQILMNLISNALKFTPPRGQVRVSLELIGASSSWLEIRVQDTGPGIAPARLTTIFHPFTQGDSTYTRRAGGTGLGLTISRQLAEAMGGTLGAQSTEGEGSTFTLRLPHHPATLAAPKEDLSPDAALRVLLAEDNTINQRITRLLLEQEGHTVQVVANGLEAVDAALQQRFDVVLMDLQMPECDGFEATQRLRAAGSTIYIVAFSANTSTEDRLACTTVGMQAHLAKPVDRQVLRQILSDARSSASTITAASG